MANSSNSSFSPLKNKLFRALWLATVASNIGTWTVSYTHLTLPTKA